MITFGSDLYFVLCVAVSPLLPFCWSMPARFLRLKNLTVYNKDFVLGAYARNVI